MDNGLSVAAVGSSGDMTGGLGDLTGGSGGAVFGRMADDVAPDESDVAEEVRLGRAGSLVGDWRISTDPVLILLAEDTALGVSLLQHAN